MSATTDPHILVSCRVGGDPSRGNWSFSLQAADGTSRFEVKDREPETYGERLELLAVVRALEALDEPSRVTICNASEYVRRGVRFGLEQWREQGWTWECFGQWVPIKNDDLWQRLDRALRLHRVKFRTWRLDTAHAQTTSTRRSLATRPSRLTRPNPDCSTRPVMLSAGSGAAGRTPSDTQRRTSAASGLWRRVRGGLTRCATLVGLL